MPLTEDQTQAARQAVAAVASPGGDDLARAALALLGLPYPRDIDQAAQTLAQLRDALQTQTAATADHEMPF